MKWLVFIVIAGCNSAKEPAHVYLAKALEGSSPSKEIATGREVPRTLLAHDTFRILRGCIPDVRDHDPRFEQPELYCEKETTHQFVCWGPQGPSAFDGKPHY